METKFNKFKTNKKDDENLSKDILFLQTEEGYEKIKEPFEIVQITGILSKEESDKIEESMVVHAGSTFIESEVKRGQTIYLTAILKKPGNSYDANKQGVIQCRIVDIFLGLSKLNSIM